MVASLDARVREEPAPALADGQERVVDLRRCLEAGEGVPIAEAAAAIEPCMHERRHEDSLAKRYQD